MFRMLHVVQSYRISILSHIRRGQTSRLRIHAFTHERTVAFHGDADVTFGVDVAGVSYGRVGGGVGSVSRAPVVSRTPAEAGGPPSRVGRRGWCDVGASRPRARTVKTKGAAAEHEIGNSAQELDEMRKMRHQRPVGSKNSCDDVLPCGRDVCAQSRAAT